MEFLSLSAKGHNQGTPKKLSYKAINKRYPNAVTIEETKIDMVFLIDNSSSMYNIIDDVITATRSCVAGVIDKGTFCAYTFTHEDPEVRIMSTKVDLSNFVGVQDQLYSLNNCDGGTALYDAIGFLFEKAANYRMRHKIPESTVTCYLIFTDGRDEHSTRYKSFARLFDALALYKKFPVRMALVDWSDNPEDLSNIRQKPSYFTHFKKGTKTSVGGFIKSCFDYLISVDAKPFKKLANSCLAIDNVPYAFDPRSRTANSHIICGKYGQPDHACATCVFNHRGMCKFGQKCKRTDCHFAHFKNIQEKQAFLAREC